MFKYLILFLALPTLLFGFERRVNPACPCRCSINSRIPAIECTSRPHCAITRCTIGKLHATQCCTPPPPPTTKPPTTTTTKKILPCPCVCRVGSYGAQRARKECHVPHLHRSCMVKKCLKNYKHPGTWCCDKQVTLPPTTTTTKKPTTTTTKKPTTTTKKPFKPHSVGVPPCPCTCYEGGNVAFQTAINQCRRTNVPRRCRAQSCKTNKGKDGFSCCEP